MRNTDFAIATSLGSGVMEQAWYLTGMERFFMDIVQDPDFIEALLDKVLETNLGLFEQVLSEIGEYLDIVQLFTDIGAQNGPLVSPKWYREVCKPRDKQLIETIKSNTKAKVAWHSCGDCSTFIPDLIDIGVDILNPVQVNAANMNPRDLKKKYGDKISFWGGIDTQKVLPFGSPTTS